MKANIHPEYRLIEVTCNCGNTFTTGSTYTKQTHLKLEICSACHPFYTGTQKYADTERRIDKYYQKYAKNHGKTENAQANSADKK